MTLNKQKLLLDLTSLSNSNNLPSSASEAAAKWSEMYHSYALSAVAGGLIPSGLFGEIIKATLITGGNFYLKLDTGIQNYWRAATWVGAAGTGKILTIAPLSPQLMVLGTELITSKDISRDNAVKKIADILHNFTLKLAITVTPPSGTPFIVFPI